MWLKTAFIYFLIILDVMMFPFSCSDNYKENNYVFRVRVEDKEHETGYFDDYVKKLPKDNIIDFPEDFTFEKENYEIVGWYVYHHEDEASEDFVPKLISFPYEVQEEDCLKYYQGYRNSVIFIAVWEYTGNATN